MYSEYYTLHCIVQSPYCVGQVDIGSCSDEIVHHISIAILAGREQRSHTNLCVNNDVYVFVDSGPQTQMRGGGKVCNKLALNFPN